MLVETAACDTEEADTAVVAETDAAVATEAVDDCPPNPPPNP